MKWPPRCRWCGCERDAALAVYWPGRMTVMCQEHARAALCLAQHMGLELSLMHLDTIWSMTTDIDDAPGVN